MERTQRRPHWVCSADNVFWWWEDQGTGARRRQRPLWQPAPTVVYDLEAAAILSDHLHNAAQARRAEAEEARRQAAAQSQAPVKATATVPQAAHANAVTLADATPRAEAIAVLRPQELEATASNHGAMQAAALQTAQEDAARHRPGPLAIEDAFPADVVDGTIPDATNAQALHGGGAATTAPATPPAVTTVTVVATPIGFFAKAAAT